MDNLKNLLELKFGPHMMGAIDRYLKDGIAPGGFLTAIISNDLKGAFNQADNRNVELIGDYVYYFYNYVDCSAWGSRDLFEKYLETKRKELLEKDEN